MVAVPPPCPPTLEKPLRFTLTISQLESLYQQLFIVAPTGTYWGGGGYDMIRSINLV